MSNTMTMPMMNTLPKDVLDTILNELENGLSDIDDIIEQDYYGENYIDEDGSVPLHYLSDTTIQNVRVKKIPLDVAAWIDIATGKGIRITSVESFDKKNNKEPYGLQSDFFGTDFSSDAAYKERYSCKCGKYTSMAYHKMVCENCASTIEYYPSDLSKFGWIITDKYQVIAPIYYAKLSEALGKIDGESVLRLIISRQYEDEHEHGIINENDKFASIIKKHPFIGKGIIWLRENFDEVLDYYQKRKPNKYHIFEEIRNEIDNVWTHSIPVITALLRVELPGEKGAKDYKLKINTCYRSIIKLSNRINEFNEDELDFRAINSIDIFLSAIQKEVEKLVDITTLDLADKYGIVNRKVLGGRYNFTARSIAVPQSGTLRSDEVLLGYVPALELYRYEIQNEYRKIFGVSPTKANLVWKRACVHFDSRIYAILKYLIEVDLDYVDPDEAVRDSQVNIRETKNVFTDLDKINEYYRDEFRLTSPRGILVQRNPSINYGSIMWFKVVGVKKDINDKTITVSSHILGPFNLDFDGDALNCFRIIGEDFQLRFALNLNPRYNLMLSRMSGNANSETVPVKDEIIAFWAFNNI